MCIRDSCEGPDPGTLAESTLMALIVALDCASSGLSSQHISFSEHVSVINDLEDNPASTSATDEHDDLSYIDEDRNQYGDLLQLTTMKRWDYPVFELCDRCPDTLLSRVSLSLVKHHCAMNNQVM